MKHLIIAGATASGKSSYAMKLAEREEAVIFNCDSRQLYKGLPILSACPTPKDKNLIQHFLYQIIDGTTKYDVVQYLKVASKLLSEVENSGRKAIFVGGTGFYIKALLEGFIAIPEIDPSIVENLNKRAKTFGSPKLHKELQLKDPVLAKRLSKNDTQRVVRGLSVFEGTKKTLSSFQFLPKEKIIKSEFDLKIIERDMEDLSKRIKDRIDFMFENGAIEEVEALLKKNYPSDSPILKSIGILEISELLKGDKKFDQTKVLISNRTRQYAKRQRTWFRTQLKI